MCGPLRRQALFPAEAVALLQPERRIRQRGKQMDSKAVINRRTAIGAALVARPRCSSQDGYGRKGRLRPPIPS